MPTKPAKKRSSVVSNEQWNLPVSFDEGGEMVSLRDYVKADTGTLAFSTLSDDQRTALAAKRIELQPTFDIATIGAGVLDKERALAEVRGKTKLGRRLAEIETRVIMNLLEETAKQGR